MHFLDELLQHHQVRRTRAQKTAFLEYAKNSCEKMGYSCQIEEHKGMPASRNLIVGDIETAQAVFMAHYDTCSEMPLPNLVFPKNKPLTILVQMPLILAMVALALGAGFLLESWTGDPRYQMVGFLIVYWAMFLLIFLGPANRHTANDNTSGTAALLQIMQEMPAAHRNQAAFIFFDNEEFGKVGSKQYAKAHPGIMEGKVVLNLDCIGDGDDFMIVAPKKADDTLITLFRQCFQDGQGKRALHCSAKNTHYNSDQLSFPNAVAIAACQKNALGYFIPRIHTRRDVICEKANLDYICRGALQLMDQLSGAK